MRRFPKAAVWLAAFGLACASLPAYAAVATGNIRVSGSRTAGYTISYDLAEEATLMQVKVYNAAGTLVRTFDASEFGALTQGRHTTDVVWDGKTDGGVNVPVGDYYVTLTTTGAAVSELALRSNPVMQVVNFNGKDWKDGRFYYGLGVNAVPDSPYKNLGYIASASLNTNTQLNGTWLVGPSAQSAGYLPTAPLAANYNWISADVLSDGTVVHLSLIHI